MVIRKVAGKLKKELKLYGGHLEQPGFINQLKSQISELCQYGVSVEDLAMVEEETDRVLLKDKLGDLKTVYGDLKIILSLIILRQKRSWIFCAENCHSGNL